MNSRTIEISSDSDEDQFWDATEDEWWRTASESADNSPAKAGSSSDHQMEPYTPVSYGLAKTMEAGLNLKSGGARFDNGSPTKARPHSVASGSKNSPQLARTPTSFEKRTRSAEEPASSYAKSIPTSNKTAVREASSPTVPAAPSATSMRRLASLIEVYESRKGKTPSDKSSSNTAHPGPIRSSVASSSNTTTAPSKSGFAYDSDVDMDENEVEQLVDTDTESSVPPTRENSLMFPTASRTTSMTSVLTDISVPSSSGSRKRSIEYQGEYSYDSAPATPPKVRRTTDGPQTRMDPPSWPELSRASTHPIPATKRLYPELPVDEPSIFRVSPAKSAVADSNLARPATTSSTPRTKNSSQPTPAASSSKKPFSHSVSVDNLASQDLPHDAVRPPVASSSNDLQPDFSFLDHSEGADLPICIIAHDRDAQKLMDSKRISLGVQWEIARGISRHAWEWSDVTPSKLDLLRGSNADAAWKVVHVMKTAEAPSVKPRNLELWREMDREQKAILENRGRGLGLMGDWEGESNWWGGRIQQILRLAKAPPESAQRYIVYVEKLENRRSHRFGRLLGSPRINQMRIDSDLMNKERDQLLEFLLQNFVLCGRIYRPFASKDGTLYLMQPNLNYERTTDPYYGDQYRISFADFIRSHNPLHLNYNQPISKWSTRWALGLSTSRPVLEFAEENICCLPDLPLHDPLLGKLPAEKILTDGCGFINAAALTAIWNSEILKLPYRPVTVQGRIAGDKGMWLLHPNDQSKVPCIYSRPSQHKIELPRPLHRAHLIFDLLSPSRVSMPSHLSMQTINCLSHNGVPDSAFKALIEQELDAIIQPLTDWEGPSSMLAVAKAVERAGRITGVRLQRVAGGSTKALGLGRDFHRDDDDGDADDEGGIFNNAEPQVSSGRELFSEAPRSVFESAYELILAGFHPLKLKLLYDKMQKIVTYVIDNFVKNLRIPVSESVEAYIVPDPKGVLEEGQIYFCSSSSMLDPTTGALFNTLMGRVLVGRNPTRLASDLQKVDAVDHPELHGWYDVIIFSTKGERSLASLLAGGDYDGDTVMLFWAKLLLESFRNSPFCEPPADLLTRNFHREIETVVKFSQRVSSQPSTSQRDLQKVNLLGLADTKVGLYSIFHDNVVYKLGYGSEEAVRMAYMFNTCLDSPKTGHRLENHIFLEDRAQYGRPRPSCMVTMDQVDSAGQGHQSAAPVERSKHLGTFVLDSLVAAGRELRIRHLQTYDLLLAGLDGRPDHDLLKPFEDATTMANEMERQKCQKFRDELMSLKAHVGEVQKAYQKLWASPRKPSSSRTKKGGNRKDIDAALADIARQFAEGPSNYHNFMTPNLAQIKASYAYSLSATYGFSMAYRDLCTIKAVASQHIPIARSFAETMSIAPSFLRVLGENSGEC